MTDIIQETIHPHLQQEIERMEAAHQVEMAELRTDMQDKIDELQEQIDDARSTHHEEFITVETLARVLEEKKNKDKEKYKNIEPTLTFKEFSDALNSFNPSSYQKEYSILDTVCNYLNKVEIVKDELRIVEEVLPSGFPVSVRKIIKELEQYL